MLRKRSTPPKQLAHGWYLAEWAGHFGKRQADAQRELGWPKATASRLWNGKQRYTQDLVDEVSEWLGITPPELLMPPAQALAIRNFRASAMVIAAEPDSPPFVGMAKTVPRDRPSGGARARDKRRFGS